MSARKTVFLAIVAIVAIVAACSGKGDINLAKATPLGVEPTTDSGNPGAFTPAKLFAFQPGEQVSFKLLADGTEVGGSPIIDDFDGDGMDNVAEVTTNVWSAEVPQITTRVVTPVTMEVEALSMQTGLISQNSYTVSGADLSGESSSSSERFYKQTLSAQALQYEKKQYPLGVPSGNVSDFVTPGIGFFSLAGQSSGLNNGVGWAAYSQPAPVAPINIDGAFGTDMSIVNWSFKDDFSTNAAAQYRIWKRDKEANSYQVGSNAGKIKIAMYIRNGGSNVPVRLSNILAALVFETQQGTVIPAVNFRLRDVSSANLYSLELNANTEFGPYLIEIPNISTELIEKAIRHGYTPQIRLIDYDMTHTTNSPYRLSLNFTGDNLKVMENNARGRSARINIIGPTVRQSFHIAAFSASTENAADACAPVAAPDATSTASPGVPLTRALDRAACSMAVGGKVGGVPVVEYQNYVLDFTGVPLYDAMTPKVVFVTGIKKIGHVTNSVTCDPAFTNVCYIRFADYLTAPNNNFALWTVFAKAKYFNYSQFDYINTSGSGTVRGYPSGSFNSNTRTGAIPRLKGVNSTIWAGDTYDVVYLKVSDIIALRAQPGGSALESGVSLNYNTKWDISTVGSDPFAPNTHSRLLGKATLGDTLEITFNLKDTTFLNPDFGPDIDATSNLAFNQFTYNKGLTTKKFSVNQAIDFELSLGFGNQPVDWQNILQGCPVRPKTINAGEIQCVKTTTDFVAQKFTVQIKLPSSHPQATAGDLLGIYLRPSLSNAYRNSIWPQDYRLVKSFDSQIYETVASGRIIKVKPGLGVPQADTTVRIDYGLSSSAMIHVLSVTQRAYGYDMELEEDLNAYLFPGDSLRVGDRVSINAGLPYPGVNLRIDRTSDSDSFFTAYNAQYPQQQLLANAATPVSCSLDLIPSKCYGYASTNPLEYITNNWLGNMAFGNSWFDASQLSSFADGIPNDYVNVGGKVLGFEFPRPNFVAKGTPDAFVSQTTSGNQNSQKIAISGTIGLIVWKTDLDPDNPDIRGQIVDLDTGNNIGSDFLVSTSNVNRQSNPQVIAAGGRALVVWESEDLAANAQDIRGRLINLDGAMPIGDDFLVSTTNQYQQLQPTLSAFGDKAFVVWTSTDNGLNSDIRGRMIDLNTGLGIGSDLLISDSNAGYQDSPQISASGNKVLIVWLSGAGSFMGEVRARLIDMNSGAPIGNDFSMSTFNQGMPKVATYGKYALAVWPSYDSGISWDIHGRIFDMESQSLNAQELLISTSNENSQNDPQVAISNNRALVVWSTNDNGTSSDIRGRLVDLVGGTALGSDFLVSSTNAYNQQSPQLAATKDRAFVLWQSADGGLLRVRGRVVDLTVGGPGVDMLLSNTTSYFSPSIAINDTRAGVAWRSDNGAFTNIRWRPFWVQPSYGPNNFFTAPLIERNYEATAQIVK